MTNVVIAVGPDYWGSGLAGAENATQVADFAARHAQSSAESVAQLAQLAPAAVAALALGLALWLVGDRLFRPAASLVGAVLGALLGLTLGTQWESGLIVGLPAPYAFIGLGALIGLGLGALMYRLAVGAVAGLTIAGVAGAIAACVALQPVPGQPIPDRPETVAEVAAAPTAAPAIQAVGFGEAFSVEGLRSAAASMSTLAQDQWAAIPGAARSLIMAAGILGSVLGFAFGVIRPRTVAPAIAALAGSALWLAAATALLVRTGGRLPSLPSERPGAWLAAWLLVALIGFAVQRRVIRPSALVDREQE
ncbi:MAG: hypothetical protein IPJ41_05485 [Phycisphaerales bacterium]|nr:hypothetical protein [Phycisphaerales bacterium]